jgi:hypothetical protein
MKMVGKDMRVKVDQTAEVTSLHLNFRFRLLPKANSGPHIRVDLH